MSRLFAMVAPVAPGKEQVWHDFMRELKDQRLEEYQASRAKLGVRERTFYQETPMGGLVIVTLEGDDPEGAFSRFAQGTDAFTKWFIQKVEEIHGFSLAAMDQAPKSQLLIDSGVPEKVRDLAL
jgi:hypothetical protein